MGDGTISATRVVPTVVPTPVGVTFAQVATGSSHSCGLTVAGSAYCWGRNISGQLGDGTTTNRPTPALVTGPAGVTFTQIATGNQHSCAVTASGAAYCWGFNLLGQVGDGSTTQRLSPTLVAAPVGVRFTQITTGNNFSCAVTSAGAAYCWGENNGGRLGLGTGQGSRQTPSLVAAPAGVTFTQVASGFNHSCAVTATGAAYCWGDNSFGKLGDGTTSTRTSPALVTAPAGVTFTQVVTGGFHSCGVTAAGATYCWGNNQFGRLGDGTSTTRLTPAMVVAPAGVAFAQIASGEGYTCGATAAAALYCWGFNESGQLGDGTTTARLSPALVSAPAGVSFEQIATGGSHSCSVTSAGDTYCWGLNSSGQLGLNPYVITQFLLP